SSDLDYPAPAPAHSESTAHLDGPNGCRRTSALSRGIEGDGRKRCSTHRPAESHQAGGGSQRLSIVPQPPSDRVKTRHTAMPPQALASGSSCAIALGMLCYAMCLPQLFRALALTPRCTRNDSTSG